MAFGIVAKEPSKGRELIAINPFAIATHIQNMFVVTEFVASHDVMVFLSRLVCLGGGSISRVAWADGRKNRIRIVEEFDNYVWWQS